jgi:hypothetical protein
VAEPRIERALCYVAPDSFDRSGCRAANSFCFSGPYPLATSEEIVDMIFLLPLVRIDRAETRDKWTSSSRAISAAAQ